MHESSGPDAQHPGGQAAHPGSALRRLGRWCYRRHRRVLLAWVALIVVLGGVTASVGTGYSSSFGDFESEATRGFDLIERSVTPMAVGYTLYSGLALLSLVWARRPQPSPR